MAGNKKKRKKGKKQSGKKGRQTKAINIASNAAPNEKALVDIITPVYGSPNLLMGTISSMMLHPPNVPWHWWIIDDNTPEEKHRPLLMDIYNEASQDPHIDVLLNNQNQGFAKSNNSAVSSGKAPYILLLNSDVRVTEGWLQPLLDEMKTNFKAGVVGSKLVFFPEVHEQRGGHTNRPAGRIQHAGVAFNILKQPFHIHLGWSVDNPRVNEREVLQAVTGAALLTRRSLWDKIGGLNEIYEQGNFEDVEYCLRARDLGFEVVYRPDSIIYHYAGGSGNSQTAMRNAQVFQIRCGNAIIPDDHLLY